MPPIWEQTDCELTLETVAALIEQQAGHLALDGLRFLDEGWDSWAYTAVDATGDDWIFRFPKRRWVASRLERELNLLPLLRERLTLPVPRFEVVGRPANGYPHAFTGYRMLPGTPAIERLDEPLDLAAIGAAAGTFLAVLHESPPEWERHLPPDADQDPEPPPEQDIAAALAKLDVYGAGVAPEVRAVAAAALRQPAAANPERVLAHCDFFTEHVLIEDGRAAGVIDWGDVAFGDPAEDLAGLYYWHGEALLAAGLDAYGAARKLSAATLQRFAERARSICVQRAVEDLEYGTLGRRPQYYRVGARFLEILASGR